MFRCNLVDESLIIKVGFCPGLIFLLNKYRLSGSWWQLKPWGMGHV